MKYNLENPIYQNISDFEVFLQVIGFKRIEGTIFGFLALTNEPVTSEEICSVLGLSQGTVSQALRGLAHWGAVETRYETAVGAQTHRANLNSLQVVSTIFRKREQGAMAGFKDSVKRSLATAQAEGDTDDSPRIQRLQSIVSTCEVAETIMSFVINVARVASQPRYEKILKALPKTLDLLVLGMTTSKGLADKFKSTLNAIRT